MGWLLGACCLLAAAYIGGAAIWGPRRLRAGCVLAVRELEASRLSEATGRLRRLRRSFWAKGPLAAAIEYDLGVAALRAGQLVEAAEALIPLAEDEDAPPELRHPAACHASIVLALSGALDHALALLGDARSLQPAAAAAASSLPLVAADAEVQALAEAVVSLYTSGKLAPALLERPVRVLALDAHSLTALRVLRAYARHLAGDAEEQVLQELLAVAQHGRPQEFAYLTAGLPRLRSFLLTRAA